MFKTDLSYENSDFKSSKVTLNKKHSYITEKELRKKERKTSKDLQLEVLGHPAMYQISSSLKISHNMIFSFRRIFS